MIRVEKRERRQKDMGSITTVKGGEEKEKDKETTKEEQTAFFY